MPAPVIGGMLVAIFAVIRDPSDRDQLECPGP
jgi:hypothetical protein